MRRWVGGWVDSRVDEQMDDGFVDQLMDRGNKEGGWRVGEQRCRWCESVAKFVTRVPSLTWLLSLQRPVTLRNAASGPSRTLRRSQVRRLCWELAPPALPSTPGLGSEESCVGRGYGRSGQC